MAASSLIKGFLDRLFPPRCVFCRRVIADRRDCVCERCSDTVRRNIVVKINGVVFCRGCAVPFIYDGLVRSALLRYKFRGFRHYAACFGSYIAECALKRFGAAFDLVTWVPVSAKRARQRGYDQAELLAQAVSQSLGIPAAAALIKTVDNPAQSAIKGAGARRANVKGVYLPSPDFPAAGLRVLLIDDVITTGATISEAARALLTAGAEEVFAGALARAK
ncbi:MAG: ComF family protein [Clostridiales bacterium]|jgi:ComF family protein|nr:ComF family protein [Clostridiales bacterium]